MGRVDDRVLETTTSTGTGNITLAGAPTGYVTFNDAPSIGVGPMFYYLIDSPGGSEWEVGEGYLTSSTTMVRLSVTRSSNAGALVNFSAGTKNVRITFPASEFQDKGVNYAARMGLVRL